MPKVFTLTIHPIVVGFVMLEIALTGLVLQAQTPTAPTIDYHPFVAEESSEAQRAIGSFKPAAGMRVELIAAEPLLANPVAFTIDRHGKIFVAETFRHFAGVTDMRRHTEWLEDDLSGRTIEDRLMAMKKNLGTDFASYTLDHDRVRLLLDTNGDGKPDETRVFADGFKDALAGIGSGVLEDRGSVYYACIPDLWKLRDGDGDGRAEERQLLSSGYGVHISLLGHDSHGLIKGPDGRIYFSIGDRGFNVPTENGRLEYPDTGAVLRCNPDGTALEVIHQGLRNPQELAFDDWGNLFTGDNNSDSGDLARLVYIVEGGDSGWIINHQWAKHPMGRGTWNSEKLWHLEFEGQAAWIVPPLAHIGAGPSGLAHYPGTGLPERYQGAFFLCDFRGNNITSLVHAFWLKPKGASFEMVDRHDFIRGILATDVGFGLGNGVYLSDWTNGWNKQGKGRLYRVFSPSLEKDPTILETKTWLPQDLSTKSDEDLAKLLGHADQRVRFEAQWALADRGQAVHDLLVETARNSEDPLARCHAIWGLWQLGLRGMLQPQPLTYLLADPHPEIRAQAARVLGDLRQSMSTEGLISRLGDASPRVRFLAAIGLGRIGSGQALAPLVEMIRENADADVYLRHAGVMGLSGVAGEEDLVALADDPSSPVRLAAVLALRRHKSPLIGRYLKDPERSVVLEAARAINDVPILEAFPALAALLPDCAPQGQTYDRVLYDRAINVHYRLGQPENAEALASFAAREEVDEGARSEALDRLSRWAHPSDFDRVLYTWRPLEDRTGENARSAVEPLLANILAQATGPVKRAAVELVGAFRFSQEADRVEAIFRNPEEATRTRMAAVETLAQLETPGFPEILDVALEDPSPDVREEATKHLERVAPGTAAGILAKVLESGTLPEKQAALGAAAALDRPETDDLLSTWMARLLAGSLDPRLELDLLEAVRSRKSEALSQAMERYEESLDPKDPLAAYRACLLGGDSGEGWKVFFEKDAVSCQRCHRIGNDGGGEAGPDLTGVGSRWDREYFLESVVLPNARIAQGFENVTLALEDGTEISGRVLEEDALNLRIEVPFEEDPYGEESLGQPALPHSLVDTVAEGQPETEVEPLPEFEVIEVSKEEIRARRKNLSSMPEGMGNLLSPRELRNLIEFLAHQK